MAAAFVQVVKTVNSSGNTVLTTNSITVSTGALLVLAIAHFDPGSGAQVITSALLDNSGATPFIKQKEILTIGGGDYGATIYTFANASSGAHTVTVTWPHAYNRASSYLIEVSGAVLSAVDDGTGASAIGTSTAAASGNMSGVTLTDDFWVALVCDNDATSPSTVTAGSGWTIPTSGTETDGTVNQVSGVEYQANPGTTTGNGQFTVTSSSWGVVAFAFKSIVLNTYAITGISTTPVLGTLTGTAVNKTFYHYPNFPKFRLRRA